MLSSQLKFYSLVSFCISMMNPSCRCITFVLLVGLFHSLIAEDPKQQLQELCSKYKFLWTDSNPSVFYYCFTNKAAVELVCRPGHYMCKDKTKTFEPCACRFKDGEKKPQNKHQWSQERSFHHPDPETGEFASDGCPDPYLKYPNHHRFGGSIVKAYETLGQCQKKCLDDTSCAGIDWDNSSKSCYILGKVESRFGIAPKQGTDHYMRTQCSTGTLQSNSDVDEFSGANKGDTFSGSVNGRITTESPVERRDMPEDNHVSGDHVIEGKQAVFFTTTQAGPVPTTKRSITQTEQDSTGTSTRLITQGTQSTAVTTTPSTISDPTANPSANNLANCPLPTIPDSGCPYDLQILPNMNHAFGRNITSGIVNGDRESCKGWCVIRGYCKGVDFDRSTNTCYMFTEVKEEYLNPNPNVDHYQKVICGKPLTCWAMTGSMTNDEDIAVVDVNTPMESCHGYCYLRQTLAISGSQIQRGCIPFTALPNGPNTARFCQPTPDLVSVECFCDTDRCNGLSLSAWGSQILYLPLDKDLSDHSGYERHGVVDDNHLKPEFSCLDRAVNCSAKFTGQECIEIRQLADTEWGTIEPTTETANPLVTFSIWFKRAGGGFGEQVFFGNGPSSLNEDALPSFQFKALAQDNFISAGINSADDATDLEDFKRGSAPNNVWNHALLTYDGRDDIANDAPLTRLYINGVRQSGNEQDDMGPVKMREGPVYIGCMGDTSFLGMIDEVRIFTYSLSERDIQALLIMRDANYE